MITVGPSETPVLVYTASAAGIHNFVLTDYTSGGGAEFFLNGERANGNPTPSITGPEQVVQVGFVLYLAFGDEITYKGPEAHIAGVRLGDELSD